MSDDVRLGKHCHCSLHPPRHSDMSVGCDNERPWDGSTTGCDPAAWPAVSDIEVAIFDQYWSFIERHIAEQAAEIERLEAALRLLKPVLSEMGPEVPRHSCGYIENPETGFCWFCDSFGELWSMVDPDDWAAGGALAETEARP